MPPKTPGHAPGVLFAYFGVGYVYMAKRIIVATLALVLVFGAGLFVGTKRATAPTNDQFVAVDGSIIPFESVPDELSAQATSTDAVAPVAVPTQTTKRYESPFGFSVQYSSAFQSENAWVVLPGNQRIAAFALARYVPVQHCSEAGYAEHCRPFLENPAIAFGVIDASPRELVAKHLDAFSKHLESVTINGTVAAQYYAAADREGVVTILVPLTDTTKTLIVQYTYDTKYDTNAPHKDILPSTEQKQLVDSVLQTLTII